MNLREDMDELQSMIKEHAAQASGLHDLIVAILDRLPLGVFVKDIDIPYTYLYWNRFMTNFTGMVAPAIVDSEKLQSIYSESLVSIEERLEEERTVMRNGKTLHAKGRLKSITGEFKDLEITKFPIYIKKRKPLLVVLWRDVSVSTEMERSLKRNRMLTRMALRTSDIRTCYIEVDPDSKADFDDSRVFYDDWRTMGELINASWHAFMLRLHPEDRDEMVDAFRKLCRGEIDSLKVESRIKYPIAIDYEWRESIANVYERDKKGRPTVILACSTNIGMRKAQEALLVDAKYRAETADKMKSKYLADMSHEIRTPLSAITGFAELMAFADSDDERTSYYEIIKTNSQLLMQLINDILDLSKIEADSIQINYTPVDVNELMGTVYASARLRMTEEVGLILENGADSCLFGTDGIRLLQLITNLLNNAIKNTHKGFITIGYSCLKNGQLRFYVRDTGVGIAPDKVDKLFNRFVKLNDYVEGIGLGLAICKSLTTKMGGSIAVESTEGKGSEFSFILPPHEVY